MYSKINFYLEIDGKKDLYAVIEGDWKYPTTYINGKWELCHTDFKEIVNKHNLKKLNFYDAAIYTFGSSPKDLYESLGYQFYERKREVITDQVKFFFDEFKDFAVDDYAKCHHNRRKDLKYKAKELDEHYGTDYYETILDYYDEYLKRRNEFDYLLIKKENEDFIIEFKDYILKK